MATHVIKTILKYYDICVMDQEINSMLLLRDHVLMVRKGKQLLTMINIGNGTAKKVENSDLFLNSYFNERELKLWTRKGR